MALVATDTIWIASTMHANAWPIDTHPNYANRAIRPGRKVYAVSLRTPVSKIDLSQRKYGRRIFPVIFHVPSGTGISVDPGVQESKPPSGHARKPRSNALPSKALGAAGVLGSVLALASGQVWPSPRSAVTELELAWINQMALRLPVWGWPA